MKKGYHKTATGKTAKKGLYYNINKRKKAGTSRSKKNLPLVLRLTRI
ncbi:hypothetical protein [uncultured phage MedDCM-OCT-S04-C1161]|nr:hypothetical protein [uncultured phage MedDCM-OCT-S04-C1161]